MNFIATGNNKIILTCCTEIFNLFDSVCSLVTSELHWSFFWWHANISFCNFCLFDSKLLISFKTDPKRIRWSLNYQFIFYTMHTRVKFEKATFTPKRNTTKLPLILIISWILNFNFDAVKAVKSSEISRVDLE